MDVSANRRACPQCGSGEYQFRSRKKLVEGEQPESIETKYRCKTCAHEWRERTRSHASGQRPGYEPPGQAN
jgi:DNA-directed RNA polymerase subunit M/transcription elongation factor TFIIS